MVPADVYDAAVRERDAFRKSGGKNLLAGRRPPAQPRGVDAWAVRAENVLASLAMGGMMLLPLSEIVSRKVFTPACPGPFAQNLTLWVGMLGAAIAAREGKLLTLATGEFLPKGWIGNHRASHRRLSPAPRSRRSSRSAASPSSKATGRRATSSPWACPSGSRISCCPSRSD